MPPNKFCAPETGGVVSNCDTQSRRPPLQLGMVVRLARRPTSLGKIRRKRPRAVSLLGETASALTCLPWSINCSVRSQRRLSLWLIYLHQLQEVRHETAKPE